MNKVIFTGNLCRDPELKKTVNDSYISTSAIAVSRDVKNEKGEYETDFFDIKMFGKTAEYAAKYLRKGSKVGIVGRIQNREYINRDQIKVRTTEVTVLEIENLLPQKEDNDSREEQVSQPKAEQPVEKTEDPNLDSIEITDDDLPF